MKLQGAPSLAASRSRVAVPLAGRRMAVMVHAVAAQEAAGSTKPDVPAGRRGGQGAADCQSGRLFCFA